MFSTLPLPQYFTSYLNSLSDPLTPKTIDYKVHDYVNPEFNLFGELGISGSFNTRTIENILSKNKRVSIRYLDQHIIKTSHEFYQDREIWLMATLCFDDTPVLLLRNTNREGDDTGNSLIINYDSYKLAIVYIFGLLEPDEPILYRLPNGEPYITPQSGSVVDFPSFRQKPSYLIPSLNTQYFDRAIHLILNYNLY